MNRLVCLGWISKPERKENFSFETRVAPLRTQPKLQPRFLTLSPMRLSHNGNLQLMLTNSETLSAAAYVRTDSNYGCMPFGLDIEVRRRNNLGEIDCQSNVAGWVRSSDDAVILVDELPKRQD